MFGENPFRQKDSLAESAKTVMEANEIERQTIRMINEELGIETRNSLPHEIRADYDELLESVMRVVQRDPKIAKQTLKRQSHSDHRDGIFHTPGTEEVFRKVKAYLDSIGFTTPKSALREEEQLDEISASKLGRYIKKASDRKEDYLDDRDYERANKNDRDADVSQNKAIKREKGISLALNKLTGGSAISSTNPHTGKTKNIFAGYKSPKVVAKEEYDQLDEISAFGREFAAKRKELGAGQKYYSNVTKRWTTTDRADDRKMTAIAKNVPTPPARPANLGTNTQTQSFHGDSSRGSTNQPKPEPSGRSIRDIENQVTQARKPAPSAPLPPASRSSLGVPSVPTSTSQASNIPQSVQDRSKGVAKLMSMNEETNFVQIGGTRIKLV